MRVQMNKIENRKTVEKPKAVSLRSLIKLIRL